MTKRFTIEPLPGRPVGEHRTEFVERKGVGHPDSICDGVMEAVSVALAKAYLECAGSLLHYNVDKALLVAGGTSPALGGGTVDSPMRFVFGDRAATAFGDVPIPVDEIAESTARDWFARELRFVEPDRHVAFQSEIKAGSPELVDIFSHERIVANDTSAAVGYAPLSETEQLVLKAERLINSPDFKSRFPETGEDVKVMGVRSGRQLELTVAIAFVDRFIPDEKTYFDRVEAVRDELRGYLTAQLADLDGVEVHLNTLDEPGRGVEGMYLTVLGTSAESADGGEVGRGNAVNGLISLNRPTSNEAAPGKNPVSHVGKIYNVLSHQIAKRIHENVGPVEEAYVWLCSQIGRPVDSPWFASAEVILAPDVAVSEVESEIRAVIEGELAAISDLTERLVRGELSVF